MGMFSDHALANVEGHLIEVEAHLSILGSNEYSLIIDNKRVDTVKGELGRMTLRGVIEESQQPVLVTIRPNPVGWLVGLLGVKYALNVGGQEYPFQKL